MKALTRLLRSELWMAGMKAILFTGLHDEEGAEKTCPWSL